MIISYTGHRCDKLPNKLIGYTDDNPLKIAIKKELKKLLLELKPEKVISGMALGFDTWGVEVALELKIP